MSSPPLFFKSLQLPPRTLRAVGAERAPLCCDAERLQYSVGDGLAHLDALRFRVDQRDVVTVNEGALDDHGRGFGVSYECVVVGARCAEARPDV